MNIVLGKENIQSLQDKYTILELDSFYLPESEMPVTAYGVVEKISIDQIATIDRFRDLHNNMMKNYRLRNWKYVEDALEHLVGQWSGEYDSFYDEMSNRVRSLKNQNLPEDWNGIFDKQG